MTGRMSLRRRAQQVVQGLQSRAAGCRDTHPDTVSTCSGSRIPALGDVIQPAPNREPCVIQSSRWMFLTRWNPTVPPWFCSPLNQMPFLVLGVCVHQNPDDLKCKGCHGHSTPCPWLSGSYEEPSSCIVRGNVWSRPRIGCLHTNIISSETMQGEWTHRAPSSRLLQGRHEWPSKLLCHSGPVAVPS